MYDHNSTLLKESVTVVWVAVISDFHDNLPRALCKVKTQLANQPDCCAHGDNLSKASNVESLETVRCSFKVIFGLYFPQIRWNYSQCQWTSFTMLYSVWLYDMC